MFITLSTLITIPLELDIILVIAIALVVLYTAIICLKISKIWGVTTFWYLISAGLLCLSITRGILVVYKLNGLTSDIITSTLVLIGFILIAIGVTKLYKSIKGLGKHERN
jgi:hypothetical protein